MRKDKVKQITVISGKGGTGKTVLTASFAALAKKACFVDCDVDAADLHLLLKPEIKETHQFKSGRTAMIDQRICTQCGECVKVCRFHAIRDGGIKTPSALPGNDAQIKSAVLSDGINSCFKVDPISCEGCAVCSLICSVKAIRMKENLAGKWFISNTKYGPFVHARLGIAQENSGKLVAKIRQVAIEIAGMEKLDYIIIDGPPGIGCPVIASLTGADLALIITEPTLSGIHDMERVMDAAKHFSIPVKVIINKYDINLQNSKVIEKICREKNVVVLGRLPFSKKIVESLIKGVPVVAYCSDRIAKGIIALWNKVASSLSERSNHADL